uniref:Uncharacterized protein n=1 Tax=Ixodes ricinus TaxID=34613 RepID=A0A6B0UXH6_IXORI
MLVSVWKLSARLARAFSSISPPTAAMVWMKVAWALPICSRIVASMGVGFDTVVVCSVCLFISFAVFWIFPWISDLPFLVEGPGEAPSSSSSVVEIFSGFFFGFALFFPLGPPSSWSIVSSSSSLSIDWYWPSMSESLSVPESSVEGDIGVFASR